MSACAHRPEDGCVFVPCARYECGEKHVCTCSEEVQADEDEEATTWPR